MARERLIKWNDDLLTWNNHYIRPKDVVTQKATYPKDELRARFIFEDDLTDSYSTNDGTIGAGAMVYNTTSFNSSFKSVSPKALKDYWTTPSGMLDFSSADFSISFFGFHADNGSDRQIVIGNGTGGHYNGLNIFHGEWTGSDDIRTSISFNTTSAKVYTDITNNVWHHCVMTYKSGDRDLNIYIDNGSPVHSIAGAELNWSGSLKIFTWWGDSALSTAVADKLALLYFYQKELSASEVAQLYNNGRGV